MVKFYGPFSLFLRPRPLFLYYKFWAGLVEKEKITKKCGERGSNTWPSDLQSDALPTELSPLSLDDLLNLFKYSLKSTLIILYYEVDNGLTWL